MHRDSLVFFSSLFARSSWWGPHFRRSAGREAITPNTDYNQLNKQYNRHIYTMENKDDAGGPSELPRITPRNSLVGELAAEEADNETPQATVCFSLSLHSNFSVSINPQHSSYNWRKWSTGPSHLRSKHLLQQGLHHKGDR